MADIKLFVAKAESLNDVILNQTDKELAWSEAVVEKNKKRSHTSDEWKRNLYLL